MRQTITIRGRQIGPETSVYIVAEMSANHGQSFEQAVKILEAKIRDYLASGKFDF